MKTKYHRLQTGKEAAAEIAILIRGVKKQLERAAIKRLRQAAREYVQRHNVNCA